MQWIHENKNKTFNLFFSDYGDECEGWKLLNQDTFRDFGINIIWAMYAVNALYCTLFSENKLYHMVNMYRVHFTKKCQQNHTFNMYTT